MFLNLLTMVGSLLLTWFALFRWRRRRLYRLAEKFVGPPTAPIFGNFLTYIKPKHKNILQTVYGGTYKYQSPIKMWIVHKLVFFVHDPVNLETIFNSPHALEKHDLYKFVDSLGTSLFNAGVPTWRKHKKLISPGFNQKVVDGFAGIFSKHANVLVDELEKHAGKGIFNVFEFANKCTISSICETMGGHELDTEPSISEIVHWVDEFMSILCSRMTFNLLYYFDFTFKMTEKGKEYFEIVDKGKLLLQKIIAKKRKEYELEKEENYEVQLEKVPTNKDPLLQRLFESSDKGNGLTDAEILDEAATIVMAGSDTTATMNSYILMMLGMHPEVQEKVYKEVIDAVGFDRPIESTDLQNLSYTELVVKETLRILPVAPMIGRQATADIELKDGRVIPKGSSIVLSMIHAHRNPEYWPDPLKFDPSRFLPEECAKRHRYCFIPFAGGPRKCIGISYAMVSMKVTIAILVRNYVIKTYYKQPKDIKLLQYIATKPADGFLISLEKRSK